MSSCIKPVSKGDSPAAPEQPTVKGHYNITAVNKDSNVTGVQPTSRQKNLVFLGDSLTAGHGLSLSQSFPSLIQGKINGQKLPWNVINSGISGDTTEDALQRLPAIYKNRVDILFVALGANDGLLKIPVKTIEKNLRAIIEKGIQNNSRVILAGMMMPPEYGQAYQVEFREMYPNLAKEFKLPFMSFLLEGVALRASLNQPDSIHPNAKGAAVIAENVWQVVLPVLTAASVP